MNVLLNLTVAVLLALSSAAWSSTVNVEIDGLSSDYVLDEIVLNGDGTVDVNVTSVPPEMYTLTYRHTVGGFLMGDTQQQVPKGGSGAAVFALPDTGYVFDKWSDGNTVNIRTDNNVQEDLAVTAQFLREGESSTACGAKPSNVVIKKLEYGTYYWNQYDYVSPLSVRSYEIQTPYMESNIHRATDVRRTGTPSARYVVISECPGSRTPAGVYCDVYSYEVSSVRFTSMPMDETRRVCRLQPNKTYYINMFATSNTSTDPNCSSHCAYTVTIQ
jgi:uncharacterized repeat protein (TIGR02543 family)